MNAAALVHWEVPQLDCRNVLVTVFSLHFFKDREFSFTLNSGMITLAKSLL